MGAGSKGSARRLKAREREKEALRLRLAGKTYAEIGEALGVTEQGAHKIIMRVLKRLNEKIVEDGMAVRRIEVERLDALLRVVWPKAQDGDLAAVDRILRISKRRSELLGLDAPMAVDLTSGGKAVPVERIVVREVVDDGDDGDG